MSRLFAVILKCFKLLDMSYLPIQKICVLLPLEIIRSTNIQTKNELYSNRD